MTRGVLAEIAARADRTSATINGLGVSLFVDWLVQDELRDGRLVKLFGRSFNTAFAYHLISPKDTALQPRAIEIKDWLLSLATPTNGRASSRRSSGGKVAAKRALAK